MQLLMGSEENTQSENKNQPIDLLEKSLKSRRIFLSEDINMKSAKKVIDHLFLLEQDDKDKPIYLFINSPGGEVNSGLAIYDVMNFIKPEIYTIACGLVASIASIIYIQPPKERRFSLQFAEFLLHQPMIGGMQGSASELEIHAKQILKTRKQLNALIAEKTGQDLVKVEKNTNRDFWMDVQESIDYGLVGKLIRTAEELPTK